MTRAERAARRTLLADQAEAFQNQDRVEDARDVWLVIADDYEEQGNKRLAALARTVSLRLHVLAWARSKLDRELTFHDVVPERLSQADLLVERPSFLIRSRGWGGEDVVVRVDRRGRVSRLGRAGL